MAELILSDGERSYDFLAGDAVAYVQVDGIDLPVVGRDNTYAETPDSEGRRRTRSRATNSEAGAFRLFFRGSDADGFWDVIDELQELVESAHARKGTLAYTPPGGETVTWDLESVSVTDLPQRGVHLRQFRGSAEVSVETKPYGRLDPVELTLENA